MLSIKPKSLRMEPRVQGAFLMTLSALFTLTQAILGVSVMPMLPTRRHTSPIATRTRNAQASRRKMRPTAMPRISATTMCLLPLMLPPWELRIRYLLPWLFLVKKQSIRTICLPDFKHNVFVNATVLG
jgi:hypothetical protein